MERSLFNNASFSICSLEKKLDNNMVECISTADNEFQSESAKFVNIRQLYPAKKAEKMVLIPFPTYLCGLIIHNDFMNFRQKRKTKVLR